MHTCSLNINIDELEYFGIEVKTKPSTKSLKCFPPKIWLFPSALVFELSGDGCTKCGVLFN